MYINVKISTVKSLNILHKIKLLSKSKDLYLALIFFSKKKQAPHVRALKSLDRTLRKQVCQILYRRGLSFLELKKDPVWCTIFKAQILAFSYLSLSSNRPQQVLFSPPLIQNLRNYVKAFCVAF